jgi:zinc/manganese transport system permease protein
LNFLLHTLFAPGFFTSSQVSHALLIGTVVALVSGIVGVFAVIRGQSFAGHALGDFGATGASAAYLAGVSAVWGFLGVGVIAGVIMDSFVRRPRERDVTTGIFLAFLLGIGALLLYFQTQTSNTTGASVSILFGSLFLINPTLVPLIVGIGVLTILLMGFIYRPLLLSSIHPDVAAARGVRVRLVSILFMSALAMAVEQSAIAVGALMSTALLIGPAATAVRFTKRPLMAMLISAFVGVAALWIGVVLAYDSYVWPPGGKGWPVSFFVATLLLLFYLCSRFAGQRKYARRFSLKEDTSS